MFVVITIRWGRSRMNTTGGTDTTRPPWADPSRGPDTGDGLSPAPEGDDFGWVGRCSTQRGGRAGRLLKLRLTAAGRVARARAVAADAATVDRAISTTTTVVAANHRRRIHGASTRWPPCLTTVSARRLRCLVQRLNPVRHGVCRRRGQPPSKIFRGLSTSIMVICSSLTPWSRR